MKESKLLSTTALLVIVAMGLILFTPLAMAVTANASTPINEYTIPTSSSNPFGITAGPDGNLWFTEDGGNKIGRLTTSGSFTEYPTPTSISRPFGITAGPDGNLWFAEGNGNKIGRVQLRGTIFYFAEGTCRPGFDPYFCIQNPGLATASVTLTYMKGDGTKASDQVTIGAKSRATVSPRNKLGTGNDSAHDFSTTVTCTNSQQIIAERPIYFNYNGVWTGGHDVVGATSPASTFYFAEGTCRPGFDPYFCIQNPWSSPADVTLTYMKGDGTSASDTVTVPKNSRATVLPRNKLGTGDDAAHDFSTTVTCASGHQIICERPIYFNYNGVWTGGHDVVGFTH